MIESRLGPILIQNSGVSDLSAGSYLCIESCEYTRPPCCIVLYIYTAQRCCFLCKLNAQRHNAVFRSVIRPLPRAFSWVYCPVPCHPLASIPHHRGRLLSAPRHGIPLWKVFFIGHRVRVQVGMVVVGTINGLGETQGGGGLVSFPSQWQHGQAQTMIICIGHRPWCSMAR